MGGEPKKHRVSGVFSKQRLGISGSSNGNVTNGPAWRARGGTHG